jgi:Protein of unknown function (DUF2726)
MNTLATWVWLLAAVVIIALALAVWFIWLRSAPVVRSGKQRSFRLEDWQPRTMRPLTPSELRVLMLLRKALPECLLLPQIALARFLSVAQNRSYNQWFGSVGRRCVDFLICSEQGDVLGVIQLNSSKLKTNSEGTQRKIKALEMAQIPVWQFSKDDLPDTRAIREMVMIELLASGQHSVQNNGIPWQATQIEPHKNRDSEQQLPKTDAKENRWNQPWPSEDARSSAFLDEFGMIEVPPLVVKGSGRTATGFTR